MRADSDSAIYKNMWYRNDTAFESDEITSIPPGAFYGFTDLESLDFPNCTEIGTYAFYNIQKDFDYNFPKVKSFGGQIAEIGAKISKIDFPSLETACMTAFRGWKVEANINLPKVTTVIQEALQGLSLFRGDLILPVLNEIRGAQVFRSNGNSNGGNEIRYIFPKLTTFSNNYTTGGGLFADSYYLTLMDLGYLASNIGINFAENDHALQTIILRRTEGVVALNGTDGFKNTPFAGYNGLSGTVYVPMELIESYKTSDNWSTLYSGGYCNFEPLENSAYKESDWYQKEA